MIKVYVAGPYSADNVADVLSNIGRGEHMAALLFELGYAPFCPWHDKDFRIKRPDAKFRLNQYYEFSMEWLKVSDCVLVLPNWEESKGTKMEITEARLLDIPVFYSLAELEDWRKRHERTSKR